MSDLIHPTAIVDRHARIGERVRIGAFAIIGPDVTLDADVEVGHHVILEGTVTIAAGARIGHASVLGGEPQDLKFKPGTPSGVRIGPRTVLREYVTVHRATHAEAWTQIGADCLIMGSSHVAHDCRLGDGVIVINYPGLTGHCEVGDRATIGGFCGIHPFTRIGEYAYIGGMAKVVADVPPYMLVEGQPATARSVNVIGLRRAGMPAEDRRLLQDAYRLLYRSGLAPKTAVDRIREQLPASPVLTRLVEFIVASRRGICGPPKPGAVADNEDGNEAVQDPAGERER